jgi:hypothetical protein
MQNNDEVPFRASDESVRNKVTCPCCDVYGNERDSGPDDHQSALPEGISVEEIRKAVGTLSRRKDDATGAHAGYGDAGPLYG